jgi:hypothetical protein
LESAGFYNNYRLWGRGDEKSGFRRQSVAILFGLASPERAAARWRRCGPKLAALRQRDDFSPMKYAGPEKRPEREHAGRGGRPRKPRLACSKGRFGRRAATVEMVHGTLAL